MAKRTYTNGEINVLWDSSLCTHCGECQEGLPDVFNPDARPWVNMKGGTTEDIREQVEQCPSGALVVEDVKDSGKPNSSKGLNPLTDVHRQIDEQREKIRDKFGEG